MLQSVRLTGFITYSFRTIKSALLRNGQDCFEISINCAGQFSVRIDDKWPVISPNSAPTTMKSLNGSGTIRQALEAPPKPSRKPRICMPSGRNFKKEIFLSSHYEAQDVLVGVDDVELISLEPGPSYDFRDKWQRKLMFRDFTRRLIFMNPGLQKIKLAREYDVFLVRCQTEKDLPDINAIEGWKEHCKTSVCWIDELWVAQLPKDKYWLHMFKEFDYIFVGLSETVDPLSKAIDRPVHWLPGGVDALRFTPYPTPPSRVIDVYSIGRRREEVHQRLLQAAESMENFYIYDTSAGSMSELYDHRQHRDLFANIAKRSRYFMVAPGKMDDFAGMQGQSVVGYRYYEGAAAGAVMIGQAPNGQTFRQMFPWPDAVIPIQPDGSDVLEVLAQLASDPARLSMASQRNAIGALLHFDWVYRWKEVLKAAGLEPSPGMVSRESHLKALAAKIAGLQTEGSLSNAAFEAGCP